MSANPQSAIRNPQSFAYLYERFPSFVQTFVHREAVEMLRQGMEPWLVSIREPDDAGDVAEQIDADIFYLPEADAMRAEIDAQITQGRADSTVRRLVAEWRKKPDSNRVFEAAWLGPKLRERGIRHVHAHFGGMAARTAWMLKKLFGLSFLTLLAEIHLAHARSQAPAWERTVLEALPPADDDQTTIRQPLPAIHWVPDHGV